MTHVLIWTAFGLFFYRQLFLADNYVPFEYWIKQTVTLSLLVTAFYLNSSVLVPRLFLRNHTALYFIIIIGIVVLTAFTNRQVDDMLSPYYFDESTLPRPGPARIQTTPSSAGTVTIRRPPRRPTGPRFRLGDLFIVILSGLVIGISTTITTVQRWQTDNRERKELERDKIKTELSLLKAQINPHFFFNTLNNIYVLTGQDPKVAGEAIYQLSKMMRYLLYDTRKEVNMLSEEIAFVKNYISLMRLRLTDVVKLDIDIPDELRDLPLAPMIFLPFIENAFKHGVSATQQSFIKIQVSQEDKMLDLMIKNSIMNDNSVSLDSNSGIGLINTRRRLDLLYAGKYTLNIYEKDAANEYTVHLVLDLS